MSNGEDCVLAWEQNEDPVTELGIAIGFCETRSCFTCRITDREFSAFRLLVYEDIIRNGETVN